MKRALVMSGGGARGSFQLGMLLELVLKQNKDFDVIRGVSVGAINAAFLAQAELTNNKAQSLKNLKQEVKALESVWTKDIVGNESVYSNAGGFPGLILGGNSMYGLKPLRTLLGNRLDMDKISQSGRNFKVGTVSLVSGLYQEWSSDEPDFLERIIASSAIPVVFPFVDLKDEQDVLVDGGVRNMTPLSSAFKEQPDEIYVLLSSRLIKEKGDLPPTSAEKHRYSKWDDNWLGTKVDGLDVLERTLDLLTDEIYLEDLKQARHWNDIAAAVDALEVAQENTSDLPAPIKKAVKDVIKTMQGTKRRDVKIYVLAPRVWYDEDAEEGSKNSSTKFSPALIRKAIQHGRKIAADKKLWVWS